MGKENLGLLISGGGTTMDKMVRACLSREVVMDVGCVIASNSEAGGLVKAYNLGVNTEVVNPDDYRGGDGKVDQEGFGQDLLKVLRKHDISVVTQNGWLPLTPEVVIDAYPEKIFNQHPGPVPEFGGKGMYGMRVHAARLLFAIVTGRDFWTAAIAQRVHPKFDEGAVVNAGYVKILIGDTPKDLQRRVLPVEHQIQIALLKDISRGKVIELPKRPSLVRPGEELLLREMKERAISLFPLG